MLPTALIWADWQTRPALFRPMGEREKRHWERSVRLFREGTLQHKTWLIQNRRRSHLSVSCSLACGRQRPIGGNFRLRRKKNFIEPLTGEWKKLNYCAKMKMTDVTSGYLWQSKLENFRQLPSKSLIACPKVIQEEETFFTIFKGKIRKYAKKGEEKAAESNRDVKFSMKSIEFTKFSWLHLCKSSKKEFDSFRHTRRATERPPLFIPAQTRYTTGF